MKLNAFWTWDAYIIGTGTTPEQDHHLTVLEGLGVPARATLAFPMLDALAAQNAELRRMLVGGADIKWNELPLMAASRIALDLRITAE